MDHSVELKVVGRVREVHQPQHERHSPIPASQPDDPHDRRGQPEGRKLPGKIRRILAGLALRNLRRLGSQQAAKLRRGEGESYPIEVAVHIFRFEIPYGARRFDDRAKIAGRAVDAIESGKGGQGDCHARHGAEDSGRPIGLPAVWRQHHHEQGGRGQQGNGRVNAQADAAQARRGEQPANLPGLPPKFQPQQHANRQGHPAGIDLRDDCLGPERGRNT